ncbi:MAG: aminotransferase class I/II-fold pyridoxal phosphate-dependent enzyme [Solirubrobacteraceae bacterium]
MRRLHATNAPTLADAIAEIDGRDLRIGDRWLTDFASGNYLGLDIDEEIVDAIPSYLARWGTQTSARIPTALHEQLDGELARLLGTDAILPAPTIGHVHAAAIPALAAGGTVLVDKHANRSLLDGCAIAAAHGATVTTAAALRPSELEELLRAGSRATGRPGGASRPCRPRLICVDGVDPLSGEPAPLASLAALAREHEALLYVDDAHGFGVLGERAPWELCGYGTRGNGTAAHLECGWDGLVVAGSLSRAFSSLVAYVAGPADAIGSLRAALSPPTLRFGPAPVAALAAAIEGLRANERRGDRLRERLHLLTARVLARLQALGIQTPNRSGFPIVAVSPAQTLSSRQLLALLRDRGVYATSPPSIARHEPALRLQLSAAHTDEQIEQLERVLSEVVGSFKLMVASAE